MRPATRPAHRTPRPTTRHHRTARRPATPPRIAYHHATPISPAPRQPRTAPPQRHNGPTPFDTHDGTSTKRTTAAARKDETTREHELTKTAQQDNTDTRRPTTRDADTRRETERRHRHDKQNADTKTLTHETRTGRQHGTINKTRSGTKRNAIIPPTRYERRKETTCEDITAPPTAYRPPASIYDAATTGQHAKTS